MRSQSVFCSCCRATFYRRRFQIFGRIRRVANLQQTRHCEYTAFHDARSTTTNPIPDIKTLAVSIHQRRPNPSAFFIIMPFSAACVLFVIGSLSSSWRFGDFRAAIQLPRLFYLLSLTLSEQFAGFCCDRPLYILLRSAPQSWGIIHSFIEYLWNNTEQTYLQIMTLKRPALAKCQSGGC